MRFNILINCHLKYQLYNAGRASLFKTFRLCLVEKVKDRTYIVKLFSLVGCLCSPSLGRVAFSYMPCCLCIHHWKAHQAYLEGYALESNIKSQQHNMLFFSLPPSSWEQISIIFEIPSFISKPLRWLKIAVYFCQLLLIKCEIHNFWLKHYGLIKGWSCAKFKLLGVVVK